jgi:hypothetical protein
MASPCQTWRQHSPTSGLPTESGASPRVNPNGDVVVSGKTLQNDYKIVVLRYDGTTRAQLSAKVDVFPHHGQLVVGHSMGIDGAGNPLVSLTYDPDTDNSNLNYNIQTTKYDFQTGDRIWSVSYGNINRYDAPGAAAVSVDAGGSVIVAGSNLFIPHSRLALWYYRGSDGALLWYGDHAFPADSDKPVKVLFDSSGSIIAAGTTTNNNGLSDAFVIKLKRLKTPIPVASGGRINP